MKRLNEIFSKKELDHVQHIGPDRIRLREETVKPNLDKINERTGQENDPNYLAYMLVYALETSIK